MLGPARHWPVLLVFLIGPAVPSFAQSNGAALPAMILPPHYRVDRALEDGASRTVTVWAHADNFEGAGRPYFVIVCDPSDHSITVSNETVQTHDLWPAPARDACDALLNATP